MPKTIYYNNFCVLDKPQQTRFAPLAQLVEHLTLNQGVQGSSPWRCIRSPGIREYMRVVGLFFVCKRGCAGWTT